MKNKVEKLHRIHRLLWQPGFWTSPNITKLEAVPRAFFSHWWQKECSSSWQLWLNDLYRKFFQTCMHLARSRLSDPPECKYTSLAREARSQIFPIPINQKASIVFTFNDRWYQNCFVESVSRFAFTILPITSIIAFKERKWRMIEYQPTASSGVQYPVESQAWGDVASWAYWWSAPFSSQSWQLMPPSL